MTQPRQTAAVREADVPRSTYVTGLYSTPESASRAYDGLRAAHGFDPGDIDVVMSDDTRERFVQAGDATLKLEEGNKAAAGAATGGAIGGGVGAALAAVFAVGSSLIVPGVGLVIAGPIAAALAGAGAGAATGGVIGALVGAGIPEDRAMVYEKGLKDGGVVVGARARDEAHAAQLEHDLETYGGTAVRR
jgi:hypothetical protein